MSTKKKKVVISRLSMTWLKQLCCDSWFVCWLSWRCWSFFSLQLIIQNRSDLWSMASARSCTILFEREELFCKLPVISSCYLTKHPWNLLHISWSSLYFCWSFLATKNCPHTLPHILPQLFCTVKSLQPRVFVCVTPKMGRLLSFDRGNDGYEHLGFV